VVLIAVAVTLVIVLSRPSSYLPFGGTLAFFALVTVVVTGAKMLNARVVITPDLVESRDGLRRSRQCDRRTLAAMVLVRNRYLHKVNFLDRDGKVQLSLAWDSYSDARLDQIRRALGLPFDSSAMAS
jgi:hypothetical protein